MAREAMIPSEFRREVVRRSRARTGDPKRAVLVALAVASLRAQGRLDFKDRAIDEEVELLRGALRDAFGAFDDEARARGAEAWSTILEALRPRVPASAIASWLEPLEPVALDDDGVLWMAGPERARDWLNRRYRAAAIEAGPALDVRTLEHDPTIENNESRRS